jgi:hypothetical protein
VNVYHVFFIKRPVADEAVGEGAGGAGGVDFERCADFVEAFDFVFGEHAVVDADVVEEAVEIGCCCAADIHGGRINAGSISDDHVVPPRPDRRGHDAVDIYCRCGKACGCECCRVGQLYLVRAVDIDDFSAAS